MHKTLAIVLFLILAAAVHKTDANISLGACSLSCNDNEHQAHSMLGLGARGVTGKHGPMGPKGVRGFKGDQGGLGATGAPGRHGPMGPKGMPGFKGDQGGLGAPGEPGRHGPMGPKGMRGFKGDQGGLGATGAPGRHGPMGPKGMRGFKGDQGGLGAPGEPGRHGPMGRKGSHGDPGGRGAPGQSCECSDREEFTAKLAALQAQIDELKGRVQPTSSNPTITESSRQVPTGWIQASNNLFYKLFGDYWVTYKTAKSGCASFGARLVAAGMRTETLRREIKSFFPGMERIWIGLDDLVRQGSYVWSDGVKSTAENTDWRPGQPDNHNGRCGYICISDGKVCDSTCSHGRRYLCELAP